MLIFLGIEGTLISEKFFVDRATSESFNEGLINSIDQEALLLLTKTLRVLEPMTGPLDIVLLSGFFTTMHVKETRKIFRNLGWVMYQRIIDVVPKDFCSPFTREQEIIIWLKNNPAWSSAIKLVIDSRDDVGEFRQLLVQVSPTYGFSLLDARALLKQVGNIRKEYLQEQFSKEEIQIILTS